MNRVIAWFSCGATSAVAAHLAIKKYGEAVTVAYIDTASEHEDNKRFLADVEAWLGRKVEVLRNEKYADVDAVLASTNFLRSPYGAKCSAELKKVVRVAYQLPDDLQVFGFHADERKRAARFSESNIGISLEYPLIDASLGHEDCLAIIQRVGIEIPIMYTLGFNNNNCIGCVKAESPAYWNRVRRNFPDVFKIRAEQERRVGYALTRHRKQPIFLDELPPDLGDTGAEPVIQCGLLCEMFVQE
jgi:3'-phosphoadenosine 5'-phosphosulfate sulfotransferase (PAPS reductase)/FAD synthetase